MMTPYTHAPKTVLGSRADGRPIYPIAGAEDKGGTEQQGQQQQQSQQAQNQSGQMQSDPTWDTLRKSWEEGGLTPGQIMGRLEASRKWEQRAKAAPKDDELTQLRADAERARALDEELSSEADKRATKARNEANEQADAKYRPMLAETAFRVAIGERKPQDEVDDFIADLNLSRFLTDEGRVDTAKVLARVDQFAPATGNHQHQQRNGPTTAGQGNRSGKNGSSVGAKSVADGRDLYDATHSKK